MNIQYPSYWQPDQAFHEVHSSFYTLTIGDSMARVSKPAHDLGLDDDLNEVDDGMTTDIIVSKYMEDIAEILSQAYSDIEDKVTSIVEALRVD